MGFRVKAVIAVAAACLPPAAAAQDSERLTALVNAYRAAPGSCDGAAAEPMQPLTPQPVLSAIRLGPGDIIEAALERAGYATELADALFISGAANVQGAMAALRKRYCATLLSPAYAAIGAYRSGADWTVILARPAPPPPSISYPDWRDAGQVILAGVNAFRAEARTCGKQAYPPAPPLRWNPALGAAALAHSQDMAAQRYFSHVAKDGSLVGARSLRAGYAWQRIGENIGFGQNTPQAALDGWLTSPGHCANIMNPDFTEMGAAYGMTAEQHAGIVYWTQVLGKPR
ncbi:CAP domain-containing protein [Duganella aceris]|uniref:CAP domain-containing protein n=1 Tax=Duganella aceris TaxID=2703883 RepID=A0ABX0FBQ0_9BURK|nr:CAP domain-containing protein [Duganella aceris]NGZ82766.1 CAP domain-containing protein [Duganella aceris]